MFLDEFLFERPVRQAQLSKNRTSKWGSREHVRDLEDRVADAAYWRDKCPKGSERRAHYRGIFKHLKNELDKAKKSAYKIDNVITEGGAVGHLMHLYDNRDLTFDEIKDLLSAAASGRLENVTEKLDGINLVFSYNVSEGTLKVARAGGDIKSGGMDAAGLAARFAGRGNLTEAFNSAFQVLQGAIEAIANKQLQKIFGSNANRWYSVEIIYTANPNVINYDANSVVFHGWPVFNVDDSGNVKTSDDDKGGVNILSSYLDKMQKAITLRNWQIKGPAVVRMQELSDGEILDTAISRIDSTLAAMGINSSETIGEYLVACLTDQANSKGIPESVLESVILRCLKDETAPTLPVIRRNLSKEDAAIVTEFVKNSPLMLKECIKPIEYAINDFAIELLKGLHSTLINDTDREVRRLRGEVQNAIKQIQSSGDENVMQVLATQMQKLQSINNITSPVEGVVFIYKGDAYKFTGSFAAANQILGIFKYGRGKK